MSEPIDWYDRCQSAEADLLLVRAENKRLRAYAKYERSLGAEGPMIKLVSAQQEIKQLRALSQKIIDNAWKPVGERYYTVPEQHIDETRRALRAEEGMTCRCRSGECDPECDGPALRAEIEWLRALLHELADDLESELLGRYKTLEGKMRPIEQRRFERDMGSVRRARRALERGQG